NLIAPRITTLDTVARGGYALTVVGNAVFGDAAADTVTGLSSLVVTGTTTINARTVTSSGNQTYDGAVTLGTDVTLIGATITTLDTVAGSGYALTVSGNAVFGDAAADTVTGLSSLVVTGTTTINTSTVTSSGNQTYDGA